MTKILEEESSISKLPVSTVKRKHNPYVLSSVNEQSKADNPVLKNDS